MHHAPRLITLALLGLISGTLFAQPAIEWQRCFGGTLEDEVWSIEQTADGGYILGGHTASNNGDVSGNHGDKDAWVVKIDADGILQWQRCLGGTAQDKAGHVRQTDDGGYIMIGETGSNNGDVSGNHGMEDVWVVKLDASGVIEWQRCLGGSDSEFPSTIRQTTDGGYVLLAQTLSNNGDVSGNHGQYDAWVVKLDPLGALEWQRCYGGSSFEFALDGDILETADGGYIMACSTQSNDGDVSGNNGVDDAWVVKLQADGEVEWQRCYGGSSFEGAFDITATNDDGYIIAGHARSNDGDLDQNQGGQDAWLIKVDSGGGIQWQSSFGGSSSEAFSAAVEHPHGVYHALGSTQSNNGDVSGNHGSIDVWLVAVTGNGDLEWQMCLGGSGSDLGSALSATTDGGLILAANTSSENGDVSGNHGGRDIWVVKLEGNGTIGVQETSALAFATSPNPTTGIFTLHFPEHAQPQHLRVLDVMGRTAFEMGMAKHNGITTVDITPIPSGSYLVEVRYADGATATERIIKL